MPELVIFRPRAERDAGHAIAIIVDGRAVGYCKDGCGIRVEVDAGTHVVQAVMAGSWKSPIMTIDSVDGLPVELQCGVRVKDGPVRMVPGAFNKERMLIAGAAVLAQYGYRLARDFVAREDYLFLRAK